MATKKKVIQTQGKRKRAVARASLSEGKGKIRINGKFLNSYGNEILRLRINEPLTLSGPVANKVDISINVMGGGANGQADAIRLASARALVQ